MYKSGRYLDNIIVFGDATVAVFNNFESTNCNVIVALYERFNVLFFCFNTTSMYMRIKVLKATCNTNHTNTHTQTQSHTLTHKYTHTHMYTYTL